MKSNNGLCVDRLYVKVGEKEILKGVSLDFELGKNYLLAGKNGSGKSTLCAFLMGHPKYEYVSGNVYLNGENLLALEPDERSKK